MKKFIGFQVEEEKEFIFDIMLQSIVHFTIPGSKVTIIIKLYNESKILVETDGPVRFSRCFEMKSGQISFIPSVIFCASKVLEKTFDEMSCLLEENTKRYLRI